MPNQITTGWTVTVAGKDHEGRWHERTLVIAGAASKSEALAEAAKVFEVTWPDLRFKHSRLGEPVYIATASPATPEYRAPQAPHEVTVLSERGVEYGTLEGNGIVHVRPAPEHLQPGSPYHSPTRKE